MKKFFLALVAVFVLAIPQFVFAADVPDIRQISSNIVLKSAIPFDENSAGFYEYICEDGNATRYFNQYARLLISAGFEIIDGRDQGEDMMIWGLIHTGKDVPLFQFKLDTPVHLLIEQTGSVFQIRTAPGITYGEE
ncbi:MAG: hypothetical protein IKP64_15060 [Selenomonadaceae bacterium]|nr:hypothetical protein [Selenomonadaceae bacterium]MBR4384861.1 hypothetical protein [Selenomonadaceae bacterium]